eukprot:TRINITY_DN65790_c7_g1_i1.p2 TRINITY_DN65790_c7_g1~~TRINITY_DN65790_c7_g1_i1.p2  ORF type:complete len:142 (+),score=59.70 TRINITY_DN65790_c7_g1_i1:35-427(+)
MSGVDTGDSSNADSAANSAASSPSNSRSPSRVFVDVTSVSVDAALQSASSSAQQFLSPRHRPVMYDCLHPGSPSGKRKLQDLAASIGASPDSVSSSVASTPSAGAGWSPESPAPMRLQSSVSTPPHAQHS